MAPSLVRAFLLARAGTRATPPNKRWSARSNVRGAKAIWWMRSIHRQISVASDDGTSKTDKGCGGDDRDCQPADRRDHGTLQSPLCSTACCPAMLYNRACTVFLVDAMSFFIGSATATQRSYGHRAEAAIWLRFSAAHIGRVPPLTLPHPQPKRCPQPLRV